MNSEKMTLQSDEDAIYGVKHESNEENLVFQYISSNNYNIQNICRLCLSVKSSSNMVSLLPQESGSLADQLFSLTSINVLDSSNLPYHICPECQDQLTKSYNFKLRSQQSDCTLKSLFQSNVVKHESDENNLLEPLGSSFDDNVEGYSESTVLDVTYEPQNESEKIVQKKRNSIRKNTANSVQGSKSNAKIKKDVKTFTCTECFQSFPNMKSLQVHKQINHSDEKSIKCNKCKDTFLSEKDYQMHLVLHTKSKNFTCSECKKDFKTRSQLKRHLRRHMEVKQHECDVCKKRFSEQYALQRHYRVHTGEALEKKHKCEVCDKRFSSTSLLLAHAHTHSGARPFACACGAAFPTRRLLRSHSAVHEPHLPHQCTVCERRFRHASTLTAHARTHSGERPYVCAACGRRFLQSSNLTQHMRTHSGEKPYSCSVCQRAFSSSSSLRSHARTHTGEKPYGCPVCGKRFARCDMTSHMRRHTGARPHACAACARRFYTAARLREHTNVMHSGEKPFECAMCQEKFATKSHLVKHIKSHDKKSKRKKENNKKILLVHRVTNDTPYTVQLLTENLLISDKSNVAEEVVISQQEDISNSDMTVALGNMEVEQMPEECQANEAIIVDSLQDNCQESYCVSENGIIETLDLSNVNLLTVNGGEISIDATQGVLEEGTVKLYQVDQSLLQISTCNGQVTISKITSKMTANFE